MRLNVQYERKMRDVIMIHSIFFWVQQKLNLQIQATNRVEQTNIEHKERKKTLLNTTKVLVEFYTILC